MENPEARHLNKLLVIFFCCLLASCLHEENNASGKRQLTTSDAKAIAVKAFRANHTSIPENEEKWVAYYDHGIWTVSPYLEPDELGGGLTAKIDDESGKVLKVYFTE